MRNKKFCVTFAVASSLAIAGSGSGLPPAGDPPVVGVTPADTPKVRTLSERIPAGGTVQIKHLLYQPRPISSGGPRVPMFNFVVDGVSVNSPLGDAAGAALADHGFLAISLISPDSDLGTSDYPFLTVTMTVPPATPAASVYPLGFTDATFQTPAGPFALTNPKPGTLTIGGSVSIYGVFPGGGVWPAGTPISLKGTGFEPTTKITTKMKTSAASYVSPTEMVFFLSDTVVMDMQPITASNRDGSNVTFYSYLRGKPVGVPSREILTRTEPIFQAQTHGLATVGPIQTLATGQSLALAVQNPNPGPVVVSFHHQRSGATTSVWLPPSGRIMDDLSALLGGLHLNTGDVVTINATSGVQILGILVNETANTIAPFLPEF